MKLKDCEVYYASDLKDYGRTEDGDPFIGEVYRVVVEANDGSRWVHDTHYEGVRKEMSEWGVGFIDTRSEAIIDCNLLIGRILKAGEINLNYWSESYPAYGSEAYLAYGAYNDICNERADHD